MFSQLDGTNARERRLNGRNSRRSSAESRNNSNNRVGYYGILLSLLLLLAAMSPIAWSQVDTGTVLGTVLDPSGAVVPNAQISITNEDTGLTEQQMSKADGTYIFIALKVGNYTVSGKAPDFRPEQFTHISINVQQQLVLDITLKPGSASSTVTVTAVTETLQSQDISVGQIVDEHAISGLPLNGRNYTLLAQLSPGTTSTVYDSGHGELQSGTFTANGVTTTYNDYLLDGITNNNMTADFGNGNSFTLLPPPDGLAEFKVETGDYSAEYGRSGGAVVNAVTKSGQNTFFGTAWEFNRNRFFDADDFFLKGAGQPRPKYNRNQFGFSLGGPVIVPHLYHGKDHTFFFVDFAGETVRQGQAYTSSVPTANEQSSKFTNFADLMAYQTGTQTDILGRTTKIGQIFDPATTRYLSTGFTDPLTGLIATKAGYVREPFAGNIIPSNRVSSVSAGLLALFPEPNANNGNIVNNYVSAPVLQQTGDTFDSRVDQIISSKDQLFARGSFGYIPRVIPAPCATLADCGTSATVGSESDVILGVAMGETHTFSANLVNEARIGYNRIHMDRVQPYGNDPGLNAQYGIPGIPDGGNNGGLAQMKITGLSELGEHNNIPLNEIGAETVYMDNVSLEKGRHSIRFGVDYERMKNALDSAQFPHGYFTYTGASIDLPTLSSGAGGNAASTGPAQFAVEPIASTVPGCTVISGVAAGGTGCETYNYVGGANQIEGSPLSQQDYRRPYFGAYYTENWKIKPKFVATLGLRWEYFQNGIDHFGRGANFVPSFASGNGSSMYLIDDRSKNIPLAASFVSLMAQEGIGLSYTSNHQLANTNEKNFSPRVGFAWNVFPKTVLRAGYGISYAGIYARGDGYNPGDNYPFSFSVNITSNNQGGLASDSGNTIGPVDKGLGSVPLTPTLAQGYQISPRGNMYNTHIPYVESMNLTLQQQLSGSQYIQVAYVGTLSRRIESLIESNRVDMMIPTTFSLSPVSASATCNDAGLYHDTDPNNPNPTTEDSKVYYDQYPCLSTNNYYMWNEGSNNYNSLQVKYEKMNHNGTSLIANYTWSRFLGYGSDSNLFNSEGYRGPFIPGFGMNGEYGPEDFASESVVHGGGIWELPFGYGRRWGNKKGLVDSVLGSWNMSGIITYQGGQPITVSCATSHASSIGCYALANRPLMYTGAHTITHWLNAAAFSDPTSNTTTPNITDFSEMGAKPGGAFGPAFHRGDLSIQKAFNLPGVNALEFRADAFNLTNTPNFGQPGTLTYTSSAFSSITSERDSPSDAREMQFSLRYIFGAGNQR
jgi:hypothetical protein